MLDDAYGRVHDYLRISVTDQCNLRCLYCMPEDGLTFMAQEKLLTFDEIAEVVRVGAKLGIRKLRITGGEPLIRPNLELLIRKLSAIPGIDDIALTTNGLLLDKYAEPLKEAGLRRVNISLDTLDPAKFQQIARRGELRKVLQGIEAAARAGLGPIKLNMVLLRGLNEDEIGEFLKLSMDEDLHIRFIEYMPIGHADDNWKKHYLPLSTVLEAVDALGLEASRVERITGNGPSEDYRLKGARGTFGLIHPVSNHFCDSCNRLRLTADGNLKPCLYWVDELDVRPWIGNEDALIALYQKAMRMKPKNHEMAAKLWDDAQSHVPTTRRMSQIGG